MVKVKYNSSTGKVSYDISDPSDPSDRGKVQVAFDTLNCSDCSGFTSDVTVEISGLLQCCSTSASQSSLITQPVFDAINDTHVLVAEGQCGFFKHISLSDEAAKLIQYSGTSCTGTPTDVVVDGVDLFLFLSSSEYELFIELTGPSIGPPPIQIISGALSPSCFNVTLDDPIEVNCGDLSQLISGGFSVRAAGGIAVVSQ